MLTNVFSPARRKTPLATAVTARLVPFMEQQASKHCCARQGRSRNFRQFIAHVESTRSPQEHLALLVVLAPWLFPKVLPLFNLSAPEERPPPRKKMWMKLKAAYKRRVETATEPEVAFQCKRGDVDGPILLELACALWNAACAELACDTENVTDLFRSWSSGASILVFLRGEVLPLLPEASRRGFLNPEEIREATNLALALASGVSYTQSVEFSHALRAKLAHHAATLLEKSKEEVSCMLMPVFQLFRECHGVLDQYAECQRQYRGLGVLVARVCLVENLLERVMRMTPVSAPAIIVGWMRDAVAMGREVTSLKPKMQRENHVVYLEVVPSAPPPLFSSFEVATVPLAITLGVLSNVTDLEFRRALSDSLCCARLSQVERALQFLTGVRSSLVEPASRVVVNFIVRLATRISFPEKAVAAIKKCGGPQALVLLHGRAERQVQQGINACDRLLSTLERLLRLGNRLHQWVCIRDMTQRGRPQYVFSWVATHGV